MFVRNARFEGATSESVDSLVSEIKENLSREMPAGLEGVKRVMVLANRDEGLMATLIYCETQAELEAANEALNSMSPDDDSGRRTAVELYEVALDQATGS